MTTMTTMITVIMMTNIVVIKENIRSRTRTHAHAYIRREF